MNTTHLIVLITIVCATWALVNIYNYRKNNYRSRLVKKVQDEKQVIVLTETEGKENIDWDTRSLYDAKILLEHGLNYINKLHTAEEENKKI